jgi:hypothetical protein
MDELPIHVPTDGRLLLHNIALSNRRIVVAELLLENNLSY